MIQRNTLFASLVALAISAPCAPLGAQTISSPLGAQTLTSQSGAQTLSFVDALRAAEAQAPRLAAQRHAIAAAASQVGRAGELPDPRLRLGLENLPVSGPVSYRYDADFMTMRTIGIVQEFPNQAKRAARNARAERRGELEEANLAAQRVFVRRDVALAWLEVHHAERARDVLRRLADQVRLQSDVASSGVLRGRQMASDGFMMRSAFEQMNDRIIEQERVVEKARNALAAWIGADASRTLVDPPDTGRIEHGFDHLIGRLDEHPMLRVLDEREALARAEVELAKSTRERDWSLQVGYAQREPTFSNMISVMVAFDLQTARERRQDRDVASKISEAEQARAQREDARRMHEAEVRNMLADWRTAGRRIERFSTILLPLARERVQAALADYRGGRGELGVVLDAERALAETELAQVRSQLERARAWAGLNYLYMEKGQS